MWLTDAQAKTISDQARAEFPREACGLIAGTGERAAEIIPIPNAASDPLCTYVMEPRSLIAALSGLELRGLQLIGLYHSHPHGDPIPSPTDIRLATYPDTPYLIVGLKGGSASLAAWTMRPGQVDAVPLHVGVQPPPEQLQPPLTRAQRAAIIISALIALLLVIVVSLSLLPPAPVIPR